jgi:hypothetical protein
VTLFSPPNLERSSSRQLLQAGSLCPGGVLSLLSGYRRVMTIPLLLVTSSRVADAAPNGGRDMEGPVGYTPAHARGRSGPCGSSEEEGRTTPTTGSWRLKPAALHSSAHIPSFLSIRSRRTGAAAIQTLPGAVSCPCGGRTGLLDVRGHLVRPSFLI